MSAIAKQRMITVALAVVAASVVFEGMGGYSDLAYHALNDVDTFFQPSHLLIYSGVAMQLIGGAVLVAVTKARRYVPILLFPVAMLAGGFGDMVWHNTYGFDGFLSPTHFFVVSTTAGLAGYLVYLGHRMPELKRIVPMLAIAALWLSAAFALFMLSIPESQTEFFDYNMPQPVALIVLLVGLPMLAIGALHLSSALKVRPYYVAALFVAAIAPAVLASSYTAWEFPMMAAGAVLPAVLYSRTSSMEKRVLVAGLAGALAVFAYTPFSMHVASYAFTGANFDIAGTWAAVSGLQSAVTGASVMGFAGGLFLGLVFEARKEITPVLFQ